MHATDLLFWYREHSERIICAQIILRSEGEKREIGKNLQIAWVNAFGVKCFATGMSSYRTIESRLIRPATAGAIPAALAADAIASARTAALADPEGESLARCLREIDERKAYRAAAE